MDIFIRPMRFAMQFYVDSWSREVKWTVLEPFREEIYSCNWEARNFTALRMYIEIDTLPGVETPPRNFGTSKSRPERTIPFCQTHPGPNFDARKFKNRPQTIPNPSPTSHGFHVALQLSHAFWVASARRVHEQAHRVHGVLCSLPDILTK